MSAKFQILVPEQTFNIVPNPSAEIDSEGWTASGSTIVRVESEARFGKASVEVTTDGVAEFEGVSIRSMPNNTDVIYVGSAYVRGRGLVRLALKDQFNGDVAATRAVALVPERWQRLSVVGTTGALVSDDLRVVVETTQVQAVVFYVDGVQIERKPYLTTYIDGDQPGGIWNIQAHNSITEREASSRAGGRWVDLDEEALGVYATLVGGTGMPPLRQNIEDRALIPGAEFQSTKVMPRPLMFTMWARQPSRLARGGDRSLRILQEARQNLIDVIKPDLVEPQQQFVMRYLGGAFPLDIPMLYEDGLGFEGDVRNPFTNSFAMRTLAVDPFWIEDNQEIDELETSQAFTIDAIVKKEDGVWSDWEGGVQDATNPAVVSVAVGPDGQVWVTGGFDTIGGVGANNIARWDGTTFYPLGTGLDTVGLNIAIGPDGRIYVCGSFTNAGGIAGTNHLAVWDPVTETWDDLDGGLGDGNCFSITFGTDGNLYAAGRFDDVGGVTANNVAMFDIESQGWTDLDGGCTGLGDPGSASGLEIAGAPDGRIYLGGAFDEIGVANTVVTNNIAVWDPATEQWAEVGGGTAEAPGVGSVRALAIDPSGNVYAGGIFTTLGSATVNGVGFFNGTAWEALGDGITGGTQDVRWIFVDASGVVYYVGDFDEMDGVPNTNRIALWDGSRWVPEEITIPLAFTRVRTVVRSGDNIYYGGGDDVNGVQIQTAVLTSVSNPGSSKASPIFSFERTGGNGATILIMENRNSKRKIRMLYELAEGERIEVDLQQGQRTVRSSKFAGKISISSVLQDRIGDIVPGSDFATWGLVPGANELNIYVQPIGNPTIDATVRWVPIHWSFDGGARESAAA